MTEAPSIRPLRLEVPERDLDDLRERLRRARLPEAETVGAQQGPPDWKQGPPDWKQGPPDWKQGPPRSYIAELARYWAEDYDWRRLETELNDHGQALTEIDGLDIHFLHVRSSDRHMSLVLTRLASSVIEPFEVIALGRARLRRPAAFPSWPVSRIGSRQADGPAETVARTASAD